MLGSAHCSKCGTSVLEGEIAEALEVRSPLAAFRPQSYREALDFGSDGVTASVAAGVGAAPARPAPSSFAPPPPPPPGARLAPPPPPPPPQSPLAARRYDRTAPTIDLTQQRKGCARGCLVPLIGVGFVLAFAVPGIVGGAIDAIREAIDQGPEEEGALRVGATRNGSVNTSEGDVYELIGEPGTVTIVVRALGGFDPTIEVLDEQGERVAFNDDSDGRDALVEIELGRFDDFTVVVAGFAGDTGDYEVEARSGGGEGSSEGSSEVFETTGNGLVEIGSETRGSVGRNGVATFLLTGTGGTVVARVDGLDGFDPTLTILDAAGGEVGFNDDADGRSSELTIETEAGSPIAFLVEGFGGQPGAFILRISPA